MKTSYIKTFVAAGVLTVGVFAGGTVADASSHGKKSRENG